ncbi:MAG: hypothetical protein K2J12_07485 [Muribaculaceae bacterium]|nr:hypothetical protein [Muribaculaceae bacterium]
MTTLDKIVDYIRNLRGASTLKKVLFVLALVAAVVYALTSCTSTRNMSLTIDKAESVNVNMTDSVTAVYPVF